jgi:DnaJ-domain-containing protein 1
MFEDLKVSEWWFIGLAAVAGYFVVKHFMDKLPGDQAASNASPQMGAASRQHDQNSESDDLRGFQHKQGPDEQPNWFRRDEEEAARGIRQESRPVAVQAAGNPAPRLWYQVLEVSSVANIDDINQAYERKIRMYHPDKLAGLSPEFTAIAETKVREINDAYRQACDARESK